MIYPSSSLNASRYLRTFKIQISICLLQTMTSFIPSRPLPWLSWYCKHHTHWIYPPLLTTLPKMMKENNLQPRLLYPARISFKYAQAELLVRQRERPGLRSQAVAWPPRLSAGRKIRVQGLWLGEAAPLPGGNSVCAQQAPARLGFPGALPQRRVVWMWFGALPGAFGLGRAQPQRRGTSP